MTWTRPSPSTRCRPAPAGRCVRRRGRQDALCHLGGGRSDPPGRHRGRARAADVVVGTRHAGLRQRLTARSCGSRRLSARSTSSIGRSFEVSGKIEFLPPGMRKATSRRGSRDDQGRQDRVVTLGHAAHVGGRRRADPQDVKLHPGRQALWVSRSHATSGTSFVANALAMNYGDRRQQPQATVSIPVRPHPVGRDHHD